MGDYPYNEWSKIQRSSDTIRGKARQDTAGEVALESGRFAA